MEQETTLYVLEYPTKRISDRTDLAKIIHRYGIQFVRNGDGTPLEIPLSKLQDIYPLGINSKLIDLNPFYNPKPQKNGNRKPKPLPIYTDKTRKYEIYLVTAEHLRALAPEYPEDLLFT